jgi:hypothetical protein
MESDMSPPAPCYVKFAPLDARALERLRTQFARIRAMKSGEEEVDEASLTAALEPHELARFPELSPDEWAAWNELWQATPVDVRTSGAMEALSWDLPSMYEAIWNGEYELLDVVEQGGTHRLRFEPHAWPFGGVAALIGFVEGFGHRVIGFDDGTGYVEWVPPKRWQSPARTGG